MELSEELRVRKEAWRELGFLLPNEEASKGKEYDFDAFGRTWIAEIRKSSSGYWDDFIASGNVHTSSIALRKVRYMSDYDGHVLEAKQIIFFKWAIAWASWKTGE